MSMEQGPPVPPRAPRPQPPEIDGDLNIPPLRETAARAESRRADRRGRLSGLVAGLAVAGVLMGGSYWLGFQMGLEKLPRGEVPLIRVDPGPVKVRPEDPGGLQVPHQNRLVFDGVAEDEDEGAATLAAPPEEPAAPAALPRVTETDQPAETGEAGAPSAAEARAPIVVEGTDIAATPAEPPPAASDTTAEAPAETAAITETDVTPTQVAASVATEDDDGAPIPLIPPAPTAEPAQAPEPPRQAAAAETQTAAAPSIRIQVGAYRSRAAALRGWSIIQGAHEALLGTLEPTVVEADLGPGRGVFFRLRAGPVADAESAALLCERLRGRDQGCLVVRP